MKVVVITGAIRRAKLSQISTTNKEDFTGRKPFRSPNQQWQSTEGIFCLTGLLVEITQVGRVPPNENL